MVSKICPKCGEIHTKSGTFCSRKCANSRVFTAESKQKKSDSNKKFWESSDKEAFSKMVKDSHRYAGPYTKVKLRKCTNCNSEFWSDGRTWCKDECYISIKRKNWMGNKQRFEDEQYDSSWEIQLRNWFLENGINFERPTISIAWIDSTGKERKYFPDFYLPDLKLFVDPKNPIVIQQQKEKLDYVADRIHLVYGSLKHIKEYVISAGIPLGYEPRER